MNYRKLFLSMLVLCGCFLFPSHNKTGKESVISSTRDTIADTLNQLDLLQSKEWVQILECGWVNAIFRFSETEVEHVYFWEGKEKFSRKGLFYLSETTDKVFDYKKLGCKNGKYIIFLSDYHPNSYDNTEVYIIRELSTNILKIDYMYLHNEAIAGGSPNKVLVGRVKKQENKK